MALNGFERTPKRVSEYLCTRPYYAFGLQLIVRRDCPIESWKELKPGKPDGSPWRIGVLGQSEAEFRLNELQVDKYKIEAIIYNGNTDAMEDVEATCRHHVVDGAQPVPLQRVHRHPRIQHLI